MDRARLYEVERRLTKLAAAMTNVVPFRPGGPSANQAAAATAALDAASFAGLLTGMIERIESAGAQIAALDRPALQIERVVQSLLDAATALESAADCLLDGSDG